MLQDIKTYLMTHPKASLHALTHEFQVPPDVMLSMLEIWILKGKVRKCSKAPHCGVKCLQCRPSTVEWFEWVKDSER